MNRSILIVICDFLLVSLLAFSSPDATTGKFPDKPGKLQVQTTVQTNRVDARQDLGNAMQLALVEERKSRESLLGELAKLRDTSIHQQTALSEREKQVQQFQQQLQARQQEEQQLQQQQQQLQQQEAALQKQFAAAQTNIQALNQRLQATSNDAVLSKESLAATQDEARRKANEADALRRKIEEMNKQSQEILAEKQKLANDLLVAEAEKRASAEMAMKMEEQVKAEREEKAKLAEGVKALANRSGELEKEIRENNPLAPNTIFTDFVTNRVLARFEATRSTLFGIDSDRRRDTQTILVSNGTNIYALCHVQDTPLTFWTPGIEWEGLAGSLGRNVAEVPVHSISFFITDPRVVLMPVSATEARTLGSKIYRVSPNPFKFQDAVVVGTRESYYGECKFEVDLSTPEYLRMNRNSLKGLFGKFNPSRGDLVFSRNGDLLGVMANSSYCMMIHNFEAGPTIRFGDVRSQHTGQMLSQLSSEVLGMPFKLQ
jgi:hypothetical protein